MLYLLLGVTAIRSSIFKDHWGEADLPSKPYGATFHLRLPTDLHERFERIYSSKYRGLPSSVILRMLVGHCLSTKSDEELCAIIDAAIRGEPGNSKPTNRVGNVNAKSHR